VDPAKDMSGVMIMLKEKQHIFKHYWSNYIYPMPNLSTLHDDSFSRLEDVTTNNHQQIDVKMTMLVSRFDHSGCDSFIR
jgi:hypothetical protein